MRMILPKTRAILRKEHGPLFFLAGPVRGGGDWQWKAFHEIAKYFPRFSAANPCRYAPEHPAWEYEAQGKKDAFDRQLTWERFYLEKAAHTGCIIFYLPEECKTNPHPGPEPYGMDTRGELGEWRGRMMYGETKRVVIGAEPGFHGLSQIQRNFNKALKRNFKIHTSLEATIKAAVRIVKKS